MAVGDYFTAARGQASRPSAGTHRLVIRKLQRRQAQQLPSLVQPPPPPPPPQSLPLPNLLQAQPGDVNLVESAPFTRTPLHTELEAVTAVVQARLEARFGTAFEVVVSRSEFASVAHFFGDLVCKVRYPGATSRFTRQAPLYDTSTTNTTTTLPSYSVEPPRMQDSNCSDSRIVLLAYAAPKPELEYCPQFGYGGLGLRTGQGVANDVHWDTEGPNPLMPVRSDSGLREAKQAGQGRGRPVGPMKDDGCFNSWHMRWRW